MTTEAKKSPSFSETHRAKASLGLVVVGALCLALSIPVIWVNNLIHNTDAWVETMAPIASDSDIKQTIATTVSDALIDAMNTQDIAQDLLPDDFEFLSIPIAAFANDLIETETQSFVDSASFYELWIEINTVAHSAFTALITDEGDDILNTSQDTLSLDLDVVINKIAEKLSANGYSFADNFTLTEQYEITLIESPAIGNVQSVLSLLQIGVYALSFGGLFILGGGIALSRNKHTTSLHSSLACTGFISLTWCALHLLKTPLYNTLAPTGGGLGSVIGIAFDIILSPLFETMGYCALIMAGISLVLFLSGATWPARFIQAKVQAIIACSKNQAAALKTKALETIPPTDEETEAAKEAQ